MAISPKWQWTFIGVLTATTCLVVAFTHSPSPPQPKPKEQVEHPALISTNNSVNPLTRDKALRVQKGMSRDEVENILGAPGKREADGQIGGTHHEFYTWRNEGEKAGDMQVFFEDGKVSNVTFFNL